VAVTGVLLLRISLCFTYEAQAGKDELCMEALHSERCGHDRSPKMYAACRAQIGVNNGSSTASAADTQDSHNIDHLKAAVCPVKEEARCMLFTRSTVCGVGR